MYVCMHVGIKCDKQTNTYSWSHTIQQLYSRHGSPWRSHGKDDWQQLNTPRLSTHHDNPCRCVATVRQNKFIPGWLSRMHLHSARFGHGEQVRLPCKKTNWEKSTDTQHHTTWRWTNVALLSCITASRLPDGKRVLHCWRFHPSDTVHSNHPTPQRRYWLPPLGSVSLLSARW